MPPPNQAVSPASRYRTFMCTTGTNGLRGCTTSETPVAKNGLPPTSAALGGRMPSRASSSLAVEPEVDAAAGPGCVDVEPEIALASTAAGYLSPHTAEKLQPPFSNTEPRSSLISPPPPPSRVQGRRTKRLPSSSSSRAQIRSLKSRKYASASLRKPVIGAASCPTDEHRARLAGAYALPTAAATSAAKSFVSFERPSPSAYRVKRRTWIFSPMTATAAFSSSCTLRFPSASLKNG